MEYFSSYYCLNYWYILRGAGFAIKQIQMFQCFPQSMSRNIVGNWNSKTSVIIKVEAAEAVDYNFVCQTLMRPYGEFPESCDIQQSLDISQGKIIIFHGMV
jgi:hypothetical protein